MSGHNKWSKVKHKKGTLDAKKSKVFSTLSQIIAQEVKQAGGDETSPAVKAAIDKARAANMPNENIERAVARGKGTGGGSLSPVVYEAYGPGGAAIIASGATDNKNRTVQEVKQILTRYGSSLAQPGSVLWAFEKTDDAWNPKNSIPLKDAERKTLMSLISDIEALSDIETVATNAST